MKKDPIRGQTIRFHFADGVMAKKTFEHTFAEDGTVTFRMTNGKSEAGGDASGKDTTAKEPIHYEVAPIRDDLCAVSYLSKGYTLTTILDFKTRTLVAFSSNDKAVAVQHGTFDAPEARAQQPESRAEGRPH
ncbi:MAG TPA: MoaF N-terminal domain-containing protein [Polyangiaceae bacterium]|jgi:hypothetical protein